MQHFRSTSIKEYQNKYKRESPFNFFQHIRSDENEFLQLADFFIGAITYKSRKLHKDIGSSKVKKEIIAYLEKRSGYALHDGTPPFEEKFNIFDFQIQIFQSQSMMGVSSRLMIRDEQRWTEMSRDEERKARLKKVADELKLYRCHTILNGDETISISAPTSITMSSKEISLLAEDKITLTGDNNIEFNSKDILANADTKIELSSGDKIIESSTTKEESHMKYKLEAQNVDVNGAVMANFKGGILNLN